MEAITGAARSMAAVSAAKETAPVRRPDSRPQSASKPVPVMDKYVPGEEREPSGLYWVGKDENGSPKVFFDDPEARPAETCTANTDKVDRELERLRSRQEALAQKLGAEPDPARARALEQKLAQVEAELSQKDNDSYRRQNTVFSPV